MVWCQTWWTSVRLRERVDTLRVPRADCEATRDALASLAKPSGVTKRGRSSAGLYLRPRAFARRGEGDPRMGILRLTVQGSETRGTDARDRCGPRTSRTGGVARHAARAGFAASRHGRGAHSRSRSGVAVLRGPSPPRGCPPAPPAHERPLPLGAAPVSYTHLRAHETRHDLVCRLLLEKKKKNKTKNKKQKQQ